MQTFPRIVRAIAIAGVVALVVVQLVPFGRDHTNPAIAAEPAWDRETTRALAVRACFDCHSNETRWPWYSHVAPMSWLVQDHVDEGRSVLNFSEWQRPQDEAGEAAEAVLDGEMPPRSYTLLHPTAALSAAERQQLAAGLVATIGAAEESEPEHDDD